MQAAGHVATNLTLAIILENLVPVAGAPVHWSALHISPTLNLALATAPITKGIYYSCVVGAATLPDLDQRLRIFGSHRTLTHSLVGLAGLVGLLLCLRTLVFAVLINQRFEIAPDEWVASQVVLFALPLACGFHILADMLTVRGVTLFWPKMAYIRLLPKARSIKNQHRSEYVVVALLLFMAGLGVGLNLLGV